MLRMTTRTNRWRLRMSKLILGQEQQTKAKESGQQQILEGQRARQRQPKDQRLVRKEEDMPVSLRMKTKIKMNHEQIPRSWYPSRNEE